MNPTDVAQYGIGFFAVACLVIISILVVKQQRASAAPSTPSYVEQLMMVIENNTQVIKELTKATTLIQVSIAKQEVQQEEILVRLRNQPKECTK